jgi:hypothetical protein
MNWRHKWNFKVSYSDVLTKIIYCQWLYETKRDFVAQIVCTVVGW